MHAITVSPSPASSGFASTEQVRVAHSAANETPHHVATLRIAGQDAVGYEEHRRPRVLADDTDADVLFFAFTVGAAEQLRRLLHDWLE